MAPFAPSEGLSGVKKTHVRHIVNPTNQSRFDITNINLFSIETDVNLNHFSSDIFENLDVDNQISLSCGQDEPQS